MKKILVILAHNDDEFFFLPLLEKEMAKGSRFYFVYTSHGSVTGASSDIRLYESSQFLSVYPPESWEIFPLGKKTGVRDSCVSRYIKNLFEQLCQDVKDESFDEVWTTAWEGGHHDHDATNLIARSFAKKIEKSLIECFLYNSQGIRAPFFRVAKPFSLTNTKTLKLDLNSAIHYVYRLTNYQTQFKSLGGLSPGLIWSWVIQRRFIFRVNESIDATKPPHEGCLLYTRMFGKTFDEFHHDTSKFISQYLN